MLPTGIEDFKEIRTDGYYYVDKSGSEKSLTEKQLQAVDWKEGTSVTFSEDSNYVIYAKVTDKAGNIKYVSTDGIVIDTIAPQVSGVESNQTYTKTQTFTVTDNNLDTVKVDDKVVTSYTLVPKKGTYTIEVTDKSGNKTTLNNITVNWEKVKKPTVESKVYTGQTLTANISENNFLLYLFPYPKNLFRKKKSLRILNISEKNFLRSYISYFFFIFAAISSRSISSVRTRNGEIPCLSASLSKSAVSRS